MTQEQLEAKVFALGAPNNCADLSTMADDQVFALIAFELWKDGMDWDDDLANLASGIPNMQYKTREDCIHFLKNIFGY